ncbi:MAG: GNAT family N-acetyltransferase [Planctomycetes bacterium]|nr:GNAT family N-acetyltransferase [Planctomycetota bacterium]
MRDTTTPPPTCTVRSAVGSDLEFLIHSNAALARETESLELEPKRLALGVQLALGDPQRGQYLVAEEQGLRVGCLLITREWSDWRAGWVWWIQSVFVVPAARGRGVYRALHAEVVARARESADVVGLRLYVDRDNLRARAVYEREGLRASHYLLFEAGDPLRRAPAHDSDARP